MSNGATQTRLAVLLFTDVVDSTKLKGRVGVPAYAQLLSRHNALFESLCAASPAAEILKHTGDGYFATFATTGDAVRFALQFQAVMRDETWQPEPLTTRVGIHLGDVAVVSMAGRKDIVGLAADLASRVMSLAQGGQILITREAFNSARQFVREHPPATNGDGLALQWMAHGPYMFKGADEPLEVFEVGAVGLAPLAAPPDTDRARRVVPHDQEQTLGWRPAVGLNVPQRVGWTLERKLGEGGFGEVWLARHGRTKQQRVFKFCFDAERLRSFKRELTLFRLMRDALGDRHDIAKLHEVKLDAPPFFLESDYTEGGNLAQWAQTKGGIDKIPLDQRLQIVSQVADAVAAAHSIGVLHKDIKPSNILVRTGANGSITPQLTDFGIGMLVDRSQLSARAITEAGFTQVAADDESSRTGTRMYAPPELLSGKPFTIQGDVYALGVLLYQMVVADLGRPLAPGWERDVTDELLRDDIAACVDGDASRRPAGAKDVADRLRALDARRSERELELAARREADEVRRRQADAERLAEKRKAQNRILRAASGVLAVMLVVIALLLLNVVRTNRVAREQRAAAVREAERSKAISQFLQKLLLEVDPRQAQPGTSVEGVVDRARSLFGDDHALVAGVLCAWAGSLRSAGRLDEAAAGYREAIALYRRFSTDSPAAVAALTGLTAVRRDQGDLTGAEQLLDEALEVQRRAFGNSSRQAADALYALADFLLRLEDPMRKADAKRAADECIATFRASLGDRDPATVTAMCRLGKMLYDAADDRGESHLLAGVELGREVLGPEDHAFYEALLALARLRITKQEPPTAISLYREVVDVSARRNRDNLREHVRVMTMSATRLASIDPRNAREYLDQLERTLHSPDLGAEVRAEALWSLAQSLSFGSRTDRARVAELRRASVDAARDAGDPGFMLSHLRKCAWHGKLNFSTRQLTAAEVSDFIAWLREGVVMEDQLGLSPAVRFEATSLLPILLDFLREDPQADKEEVRTLLLKYLQSWEAIRNDPRMYVSPVQVLNQVEWLISIGAAAEGERFLRLAADVELSRGDVVRTDRFGRFGGTACRRLIALLETRDGGEEELVALWGRYLESLRQKSDSGGFITESIAFATWLNRVGRDRDLLMAVDDAMVAAEKSAGTQMWSAETYWLIRSVQASRPTERELITRLWLRYLEALRNCGDGALLFRLTECIQWMESNQKWAEAEPLTRERVALLRRRRPVDEAQVVQASIALGRILNGQHKYEDAATELRRALVAAERIAGADGELAVAVHSELARSVVGLQRLKPEGAEEPTTVPFN